MAEAAHGDLFGARAPAGPAKRRSAMHGEAGFKREPADAYFTPAWAVQVLLDAWPIRGPVAEPACGLGHIVGALEAHGMKVAAADLHDYGSASGWVRRDFLTAPLLALGDGTPVNAVVTNPPYRHADVFLRQALERVVFDPQREGQAAFLLNALWGCAQTRDDLLSEASCFAAKIEITRRIQWLGRDGEPFRKPDGKREGPRQNHAWYVWDAAHRGPALYLRGRA